MTNKYSATELFNNKLPSLLVKHADTVKKVGTRFQVNITGVGSWHLNLTSTGPTCKAEEKPADLSITLDENTFQKLLENPNNAMGLVFSGKLKTTGNIFSATKLNSILSLLTD